MIKSTETFHRIPKMFAVDIRCEQVKRLCSVVPFFFQTLETSLLGWAARDPVGCPPPVLVVQGLWYDSGFAAEVPGQGWDACWSVNCELLEVAEPVTAWPLGDNDCCCCALSLD